MGRFEDALSSPRTLVCAVLVSFACALEASCFVQIADPVSDVDAGSGGSSATTGGSGGGGNGAGGSAVGSGGESCGAGQTSCGLECVSLDDPAFGCGSCSPCSLSNATAKCDQGRCAVDKCAADWGDCNKQPGDGCERDVTADALPTPLVVPRVDTIVIDGQVDDWGCVVRYPIASICRQCSSGSDPVTPPVVEPLVKPPATDLTARFALAWTGTHLYVLAEVEDDDIVDVNASVAEDSIELLIDGDGFKPDGGGTNQGPNDHQLFLGVLGLPDEIRFLTADDPKEAEANVEVQRIGSRYVIEAQITWQYIFGRQQPPLLQEGTSYGFTIAVNDWDVSPSADAAPVARRESHLFSNDPGPNYIYTSENFGHIRLGALLSR